MMHFLSRHIFYSIIFRTKNKSCLFFFSKSIMSFQKYIISVFQLRQIIHTSMSFSPLRPITKCRITTQKVYKRTYQKVRTNWIRLAGNRQFLPYIIEFEYELKANGKKMYFLTAIRTKIICNVLDEKYGVLSSSQNQPIACVLPNALISLTMDQLMKRIDRQSKVTSLSCDQCMP